VYTLQSYDIISIFQDGSHKVGNLPHGFSFSDITRLTMYKSISTSNFNKIAQSTAVLILDLTWENGHPPYWNYTSGFHLTYWSSWLLAFCFSVPNLNFLASEVPEICRGSQNSKSSSHDTFPTSFDLILHFLVSPAGGQSACQIISSVKPFSRYGGVLKFQT